MGEPITETDVPARMDRLPFSRWHWLVVIGLGITWLLDGLEVTLAGSLAGILQSPETLGLSAAQVGVSATAYLVGAVVGALVFGYATDRLGRKRLFTLTLILYLTATAATALSWNFWSYMMFRALTGAGIGGEYAAINSAIDELIPARVRGHVDLAINATFWIGAALGAAATVVLLDANRFPPALGWRFAFGIGAFLGLVILFLRHFVPESPRWLVIHGRGEDAERIVGEIEAKVAKHSGPLPPAHGTLKLRVRRRTPWREIWRAMAHQHRSRSLLGLALMIAQAFFYNGVFFTYGLVLVRFYHVPAGRLGWYLFPLAFGNFVGPLVAGRLFDSIGRKPMIFATYALSGLLLAATAILFASGKLTLHTQVLAWTLTFLVASSASSAAYLTVSEIFPLEIRALAIAIFYASGTLVGGVAAPALFGVLIGSGSVKGLMWGYLAAAGLMIGAAIVEATVGVKAERRSLESIASPLSTTT
jgi:MFS family permease